MDIQIPCAYPIMTIEDAKLAAPVNYGNSYIDYSCRLKILNFYSFFYKLYRAISSIPV